MEVIVIGGSAAGLKAACRISRLQPDANVRVLERNEKFGYSTCGLAYYLSGDVDQPSALFSMPNGTIKDVRYFKEVKGVEVLTGHEVIQVDRTLRVVKCRSLDNNELLDIPYDRLIFATGAIPVKPSIPGVDSEGVSAFNSINHAAELRKLLEQGKINRVGVLGGGYIGIELCEAFRALWGIDVDLFELENHVLPSMIDPDMAMLVESELREQGVNLHLGFNCSSIDRKNGKIIVRKENGKGIEVDHLVVNVGVKPNSFIAEETGIETGVTGGIKVNDRLQTSDPIVFAAGDCVELSNAVDGKPGIYPFGSLAIRMGRIVGDNICNGDSKFEPVIGASILKFFDLTIGSVGLTRAECDENGYYVDECWGTFHDRVHYMPEAAPVHLKTIYDKSNGLILGIQALSYGHIQHILDKASLIMHAGWTIDKLTDLEHTYAPPYSLPFDALHNIAFIAENSRGAGVNLVPPHEFGNISEKTVIVDVRLPHEIEGTPIQTQNKQVLEIPVEELRSRIKEIPKNVSIAAICQMGGRSWDAALILRRAGWADVGILAGGALFLPKHI